MSLGGDSGGWGEIDGFGLYFKNRAKRICRQSGYGLWEGEGEPRITAKVWYEQLKDRAAMNQDRETQAGAGL